MGYKEVRSVTPNLLSGENFQAVVQDEEQEELN
jgi:hypothetical protein